MPNDTWWWTKRALQSRANTICPTQYLGHGYHQSFRILWIENVTSCVDRRFSWYSNWSRPWIQHSDDLCTRADAILTKSKDACMLLIIEEIMYLLQACSSGLSNDFIDQMAWWEHLTILPTRTRPAWDASVRGRIILAFLITRRRYVRRESNRSRTIRLWWRRRKLERWRFYWRWCWRRQHRTRYHKREH